LYNILIEFGVTMKLVRLIKMRLNETCSLVRIGKEDAISPLIFNFSLEGAIRKVQENQVGLKFNGTY
jgi:hypothetical protein